MSPKINFEQAMDRLDTIVATLEGEGVTLDQSMDLFAEGVKLLSQCKDKLETAELKIQELLPMEAPEEQEGSCDHAVI